MFNDLNLSPSENFPECRMQYHLNVFACGFLREYYIIYIFFVNILKDFINYFIFFKDMLLFS